MSEQPGWHHPGIFHQSEGLPTSQPPAGHQRLVSNSVPGRGSAQDLGRSRDRWCGTALQTNPPSLPFSLPPVALVPMEVIPWRSSHGNSFLHCSCTDHLAETCEVEFGVTCKGVAALVPHISDGFQHLVPRRVSAQIPLRAGIAAVLGQPWGRQELSASYKPR